MVIKHWTFRASVGSPVPPRWQAVGWRGGDLPVLATYRPQRPSPPTASSPWECCWRLTCLLSPGGGWRSLCHDHTLQSERNQPAFDVVCVYAWSETPLSLSEGVFNLLSVLMWGCCTKVTSTYQIAFKPRGLPRCDKFWILKGEKSLVGEEGEEKKNG